MPFQWNIFASVSSIDSIWWDQNNSTLAAMGITPCTVVGTNALVLTPISGTPPLQTYQDYQSYLGIVATTNTGNVTLAVGSFTPLPVYKDGVAGPVLLTGGELFVGNQFIVSYDAALNGGNGGWHLTTGPAANNGPNASFSSLTVTGEISGASLSVNGGPPLKRMLETITGVTFSALTPGSSSVATIALAGCSVNDVCLVGPPSFSVGLVLFPYVVAAGEVVLVATNPLSSGTITPAGGLYRLAAFGW